MNFREDQNAKLKMDNISVRSKNHELGWLTHIGDSVHAPSQCQDFMDTIKNK